MRTGTWAALAMLGLTSCYAATSEPVVLEDECADLSTSDCVMTAGCAFVCDFGCVAEDRYCGDPGDPPCEAGFYCQGVRIDTCLETVGAVVQGVCVPDEPPPVGRSRCELGDVGEGWACAPGTEFCCQSLDQCMAYPAEFDACPRPGD